MIIQINPDWRIAADPLQWIVQQRQVSKNTGAESWHAKGFHKYIADALQQLVQRQVREVPGTYGPEALETLLSALTAIREDIRRGLEGFRTEAEAYARRAGS
jgi:hypothetical protein